MPTYRGDFEVHAEVVLPYDAPPLEIKTTDPPMELRLRNGPIDAKGHVTHLVAELVANVEQPDDSRLELTATLVRLLDVLSFVTHNGYKLIRCQRVIYWEPHATSRELRAFNVFDPYYPPLPELTQDLLDTVQRMLAVKPDPHVLRALACFRKGVLEPRLEDQFQQFWFAMEVIAEGTKDDEASPINCPTCLKALTCNTCNKEPTRRLSGRQGIRKMIFGMLPLDEARQVDQVLGKARNKLMHGSTPARCGGRAGYRVRQDRQQSGLGCVARNHQCYARGSVRGRSAVATHAPRRAVCTSSTSAWSRRCV